MLYNVHVSCQWTWWILTVLHAVELRVQYCWWSEHGIDGLGWQDWGSTRKFDCNNGLVFFYIRREPHGTTSQSLFLKLSDFCVIILSHEGIYTSGYREDEQSANNVKNKNVCVQRNASTKEKQPFSRALSYHNTYVLKSKLRKDPKLLLHAKSDSNVNINSMSIKYPEVCIHCRIVIG